MTIIKDLTKQSQLNLDRKGIMITKDLEFILNEDETIENEFQRWLRWNRREREIYKQKPYSVKEARIIFDEFIAKGKQ